MRLKLRRGFFWIAAAIFVAASCAEKTPTAETPRSLPEIKPTFRSMEVLSKPDREVSLETDELHFRGFMENYILNRFYNGEFAEIERLATIYRTGMRTGAGIEKLGPFYWAFIGDMIVDRYGVDMRAPDLIAAWKEQYPQSPTPHIVVAFMYSDVARRMESSGDSPAEQPRKQFFRDEALGALVRNWDLVRVDPYAHGMKMRLISNGAKSEETWEEAFEAAKSEHPGRFTVYFDAAATAPAAFESMIEAGASTERIANALADTMGEDGDIGYARTWWAGSSLYYVERLFERRMVNWPRIRNGFFKMIEDNPDPWNVNTFARFSCIVGDARTLLILAPAVRKYPIDKIWYHEDREYCLLFAEAQAEEIPLDTD